MGISRTWCQSGEFVLECENNIRMSLMYAHHRIMQPLVYNVIQWYIVVSH